MTPDPNPDIPTRSHDTECRPAGPPSDVPTLPSDGASVPDRGYPEIPGYEILGELGRGGMGVVYKARQVRANRVVALKMLLSGGHAGPKELARFRAEAEAVAGLSHPNIVRIYEVGEHAGLPFFTLEFCPGGSLADECAGGPMPARAAGTLVEAVARGVAHAHAQGVVHRDLKPDNVLIAPPDPATPGRGDLAQAGLGESPKGGNPIRGTPKVTDFGLAKSVHHEEGITGTGAVLGTPAYMAPEQAAGGGKRVGPAADVWALGAVLYRLLTGSVPFRGDTAVEILRGVVEQEPAPPRSVNPAVPRDPEVICLKCLNKDPAKRYASAEALADDLRRWLDGKPIFARPVGGVERAAKWVRRNRALAGSILLVSAALIAASIVSTRYAIRADTARAEAVRAQRAEADQLREAHRQRDAKEEQRRLAEQAERAARESQADTEAFSDFLVDDVLSAARPEGVQGGIGVGVTVAAALDEAEKNITERFRGRPLAEATARDSLGKTWRTLGDLTRAERHLRRAIRLRERHLGDAAEGTLGSRNSLGVTLNGAGRHDEAIALHEQTLELSQTHLGPDHTLTLTCRTNLGLAYKDAGRLDEAIHMYEESLKWKEAVLGPDHIYTLTVRNNLAVAYQAADRVDDAVAISVRTLEQCEDALGISHPITITARSNLASAYKDAGRLDQAITLFQRTLKESEAHLGIDHPDTLLSRNNLAGAYWEDGQLDESIPLFERTLERYEARMGEGHPHTLLVRANLGVNYRDAGRIDEAIRMLEGVIEEIDRGEPWLRQRFSGVRGALAAAYEQAGRFDKSEPIHRVWLRSAVERFGPDAPRTAYAAAGLADNLLRQGKHAEAEPVCRECLRIREGAMPSSWLTANAESMLGEALLGQKKYAEAEGVLLAGLSGMRRAFESGKPGEPPPALRTRRLLEATGRLVRLYDATNTPDQTAKWKAEWATLLLRRPVLFGKG